VGVGGAKNEREEINFSYVTERTAGAISVSDTTVLVIYTVQLLAGPYSKYFVLTP
jgi:hypothetical protein